MSAETRTTDRRSGPPPPVEVRSKGDAPWAEMLEQAVSCAGPVDRGTHGFHTYPAGMHPDGAAVLIDALPGPVHDPFCGGGTVLVEAMLAGRSSTGTDLSPIALLVSGARTAGPEAAPKLRSASRRLAARARTPIPAEIPALCVRWYEPHVASELARLRDGIAEEPEDVRPLLEAVLSSIVIKASFRESDTSNRRVPTHRPPGTTAVLFHKKARELGRALDEMPAGAPRPRLKLADARRLGPPDGTGLILTSPPYPGVYDYLPMQQLRHAWLGIDPGGSPGAEIGSRREFRAKGRRDALSQWRDDTAEWIATQAGGLMRGAHVAIVVGDGLVGGRPVDTLGPTVDAMRSSGLEILARASADRPDHARGTLRTEHVVLGRKR